MMFLLAYIGAPPTIGFPAAIAPPATARATTAAALSNLIFITRPPCLIRRGPRPAFDQRGEQLPYGQECRSDATGCIHSHPSERLEGGPATQSVSGDG